LTIDTNAFDENSSAIFLQDFKIEKRLAGAQ
jgi:hypothetical protein